MTLVEKWIENPASKLVPPQAVLLPVQLLLLDATIISVVHKSQPLLDVGLCVAPNAAVRTTR
jgi:hypothetical protein